jgi:hypothetical protein
MKSVSARHQRGGWFCSYLLRLVVLPVLLRTKPSRPEKENIVQAPDDDVRERREAKATSPQAIPNPPAQSISCLSPIRQVFSPGSSPSLHRQAELSASELTPTPSPNPLRLARSPLRRMEFKPCYRPPTPPTSDPAVFAGRCTIETGPECDDEKGNDHPGDGDVAIHIDVASIGLRYPIVKAYMREVRFALLCPFCLSY